MGSVRRLGAAAGEAVLGPGAEDLEADGFGQGRRDGVADLLAARKKEIAVSWPVELGEQLGSCVVTHWACEAVTT